MSISIQLALVLLIFPPLMIYAAASDIMTMTIPNWVSIVIAGAALVCALLVGLPLAAIGMHLAAGLAVLVVSFGLFAINQIGGGDAKFAAALAIFFGFEALLPFLFITAMSGGLLTLAIMGMRTLPLPQFALGWEWLGRIYDSKVGVPYGIALAIGGALALTQSPIWIAARTF